MTSIAVTVSDPSLQAAAKRLAEDLAIPFVISMNQSFSNYLVLTSERLQLQITGPNAPGPVYVDFIGGAVGHRARFGGGRRSLIGRAVGVTPKETLRVLDATAGLGRDAFILAKMGCSVTMLEMSPVIAALLRDGLMRANEFSDFKALNLDLIEADSVTYLQQLSTTDYPDVIYIDPMFPALKKSAAVKKEMRVLKQIVCEEDNAAILLSLARKIAKKRVVVKRHRHSPCLDASIPDLAFSGKTSRFDVYLPAK